MEPAGKSTAWYTSYWQFCSRYLEDKYGREYCISAEQSIAIHAGNTRVPAQLVIRAPKAPNLDNCCWQVHFEIMGRSALLMILSKQ